MAIYFDNAATTRLDPRVFEAMTPYLLDFHGNPSATHSFGRQVKSAIETARKSVAGILNVSPLEIYFTSGGTEADNTFLKGAAMSDAVAHAITSPTEHHAVLHTLEYLEQAGHINLHILDVDAQGAFSLDQLNELLGKYPGSLVSLMHGNNEIGNLINLQAVGALCREHGAIFHSDTVQTVGHFPLDLKSLPVHGVAASAHKFHGPKGTGFMYIEKELNIGAFQHGGGQERNMRGGTENVYGIIGLARALELAVADMEQLQRKTLEVKSYMIKRLREEISGVEFNGKSADLENSLYTVLSVRLPESSGNDMLLFHLDLEGISASAGSACGSGATAGSHVIQAIGGDSKRTLRFSFCADNTTDEVDRTVKVLKEFYTG